MPTYKYKYRRSFTIGHKPDGTPIRKIVRSNNRKEFDQKCLIVQNLYAKGIQVVGKGLTVEQWAWQWLETYKKDRIGQSQYKNYERQIRLRISPVIGFMDLRSVRAFHAQQVIDQSTAKSKSEMDKLIGAMNQIFSRAQINGLIENNPAAGLIAHPTQSVPRRALTAAEEATFMETAKYHRAGLWVRLMLQCGLRRGETIPLRWGDIDKEAKLLRINKAVEYASGNQGKEKSPKTDAGIRYVPIPDDLLTDLLNVKPKHIHGNNYIFHNQNGKRMTETKIRRMWQSFMRSWDLQAGAKTYRNKVVEHAIDQDITPHYLRHTYVTNQIRAGYDLKTVQYLAGHADIRTTANIYAHFTKQDARRIAAIIQGQSSDAKGTN